MIPGKTPTAPLRAHVRRMTRPYSIDRRTGVDEELGGGYEYEDDAATVELYLYDEQNASETIEEYGAVRQGALNAVCLAEADIRIHDRLEYGDGTYEVIAPITGIPNEDDPVILQLALERVAVTNETDILS